MNPRNSDETKPWSRVKSLILFLNLQTGRRVWKPLLFIINETLRYQAFSFEPMVICTSVQILFLKHRMF